MSAAAETRNRVTLLRMGVGKQVFDLPSGATLADLLRHVSADLTRAEVFVDGKPLAECLVLEPGTIVSIVPAARPGSLSPGWPDVMGDFHGNPAFDELMNIVQDNRDAERDPT
jgi:hypothetical protein